MHSWMTKVLVGGLLFASTAGPATALASGHPNHHKTTRVHRAEAQENGREATEADNDASRQAAACQKAKVSGDNVNYDDQTGTCTADSGQAGGPDAQQA